jgi:hypothetical protein
MKNHFLQHTLPLAAVALCLSSQSLPAGDGFKPMFNGRNLDGWMVRPENPRVWTVQKDGVLARKPQSSYLWSEETYGDFILEMEFRVTAGCNSGLFFRTDPENPVQGGFEIQIFDSHGKEAGKHDCGALYDAKAPLVNAVRPTGEWNSLQLEVRGSKVICHINGEKVQDLDLDDWSVAGKNPDGSDNKFTTALKDLPRSGHIGFQDHGADVFFRGIKIKSLDK